MSVDKTLISQANHAATELEHAEYPDEAAKESALKKAAILRQQNGAIETLEEERNRYLPMLSKAMNEIREMTDKIADLLATLSMLPIGVTSKPRNGGVAVEGPGGWELILDAGGQIVSFKRQESDEPA